MATKDESKSGEKAEVKTAKVDLPRARIVRGTAYGPGEGVDVPQEVADAITAEDQKASKTARQGRGRKK